MNDSLFQALFEPVEQRPMTVSELNTEIKSSLDDRFSKVWVEGEVVGFRRPASGGHWYFSLNDGSSQIKVNVWRSTAEKIKFLPQDGMLVRLKGRVDFWKQRGELKLEVSSMQPAGEGSLAIAFEQIRSRLEAEGLFDHSIKRPLPKFPRRIGVVTSATGAAFADILHVLSRRAASVHIVLFPASVQGEAAPAEICSAIARANRLCAHGAENDKIDVLIVGRGGGSAEDLWAFNDETLARAIRSSAIPIISAVGHEIDTTIADFVADYRAATPSAAAEIVAQHEEEIIALLNRNAVSLMNLTSSRLRLYESAVADALRRIFTSAAVSTASLNTRFNGISNRLSLNLVERHLRGCQTPVSESERRLTQAVKASIDQRDSKLVQMMASLDALSPLRVLERGYSITLNEAGEAVRTRKSVETGDTLKIRVADGNINAQVLGVE